jgi:hypothetical protein
MSSVELTSSSRSETLMTQPLAGQGGRMLERSLLTVANVITVVAPVAERVSVGRADGTRPAPEPGSAAPHLAADLVRGAAASAANANLPTIMTAERVAGWITAQGREP